jgi:hypothetical protein
MAAQAQEAIGTLPVVEPPAPLDQPRRPGARRIQRLVLAAAATGGVVLGLVVVQRSTGRAVHAYDRGPVKTESDTITSLPSELGQVVTFGSIVLRNSSSKPAVLERIRVEPPLGQEMTLVDLKVAGSDRRIGCVCSAAEYPPSGIPAQAIKPFPGAVVPPRQDDPEGHGVEILMGLRVNRPGEFGFRHAIVDYRIGGKRHRVKLNDGWIGCAPRATYQHCRSDEAFFEPED